MEINPLNTEELLDPPENNPTGTRIAHGMLGTALAGKAIFENLLDTQGYGKNAPIPKYATKITKKGQAWSNAMQIAKDKTFPKISTAGQLIKSVVTGRPMELTASEHSIKELESELNDPKLSYEARQKKALSLKSRVKTHAKRLGLTSNHLRALSANPDVIPSTVNPGADFKPERIVVDETIEKIDPAFKGKKGQLVSGTRHSGKQIEDFRGYANRDPRVKHIRDLLDKGKIKTAQKSAKKAHYIRGKRVVRPTKFAKDGTPLNKAGEKMGMKLKKIPEKVIYKGKLKPVWRLGFVPKIPQNLSSKLEYVTGQHYQYMDFVKTNGGYHRFRGGMRDVHNLVPHKYGKFLGGLERAIATPIVNHADWNYNITTKKKKKSGKISYSKVSTLKPAFRGQGLEYGESKPAFREKKKEKRIGKKILKVATKLVRKKLRF